MVQSVESVNQHVCITAFQSANGCTSSIPLPIPSAHIQLAAGFSEHPAHFRHALFGSGGVQRRAPSAIWLRRTGPLPVPGRIGGDEGVGGLILPGGEIADLLRDFHRAEFGAAHRAEMG